MILRGPKLTTYNIWKACANCMWLQRTQMEAYKLHVMYCSQLFRSSGVKLHPVLKSSKPKAVGGEAQQALAAHDEDEQRRSKKKVRFQMDQPWVPPHRRSSEMSDRPR